ncbi:MAG: hypothetical protein ACK5Y2_03140 [Bdellovibrionales bacterium]
MSQLLALITLVFFFSPKTFGATGMSRLAHLYACNPKSHSFCPKTAAFGQGHGMIYFEEGPKKKMYPVIPWGPHFERTAQVAQKLKDFRNLELNLNRSKPFARSRKFMASGFVGMDPYSKRHSVFFLTEIN